jgi:competence ComEA-like helix-hairpin-helix protein
MVEVNTADSAELVAVKGIGPAFARAIIAYRDALGGFLTLDQLEEVYLLQDKPDAIARIRTQLVVDSLMVQRIPINSCTAEALAAHPYIRWKEAKALVAYRNNHGPFSEPAGIMGCVLIDEDTFRKLAPYLSLE